MMNWTCPTMGGGLTARGEEWGQQRVTLEILLRGCGATLSSINPGFLLPLEAFLSKKATLHFSYVTGIKPQPIHYI